MDDETTPDLTEIYRVILPPGKFTKRLLNASDTLLSLFVVTPLVVTHWRGTWAIMDNNPESFPPWTCFLFGCVIHTSIVLIKDLLQNEFTTANYSDAPLKRTIGRILAMKIYTYIFSMGCNMHWRGGWAGIQDIVGSEFYSAAIPSIICLLALIALKGIRNLSAPPIFIIIDSKQFTFTFPTRFRIERNMRGSTAGISDGYNQPGNPIHSAFLELIDILVSSLIIGPSVISYWRGTWDLTEHYLITDNKLISAMTSFLIGIIGHLVFTLFQRLYRNNFNPDKYRLTFYIFSRTYTIIFGVVCVNGWRGAWLLTDIYTGFEIHIVIMITALSVLLLGLMRTLRNLSAAPFALATDHAQDYFDIVTMFKTTGTREPGLYVLDCIFSVLVVGTLVVVAWRGVWVLLDLLLYPDSKMLSAWGSLVIGYGIVAVTFALQPIIRWLCDRATGFWRLATADIFLFVSFIGTVNVWRGVWHLLDIYFLPDNRILSDWITHGLSFVLLALLNCSNSVLVRGVYIDAEEPAGQCVVFPIYYIRLFFQKERTKKQRRLLDALEKQDQNNFLLDTPNNIKIVKSNSNSPQSSESKPILSRTNEKTKDGDNSVIKE